MHKLTLHFNVAASQMLFLVRYKCVNTVNYVLL